ncbi:STAS domain-containing protein [Candidatus Sumerlaeota bacterium]|nr:STAS domain-containing protein [Candidatus Sumerlaeota bacterium]
MKIEIFRLDQRLLVYLEGQLVLDVLEAVKAVYEPVVQPPLETVLVSLGKVEYMDCAGLGSLIEIKVQAHKARARLSLVAPSQEVMNILAVSKLDDVFEIIDGIDAERVMQEMNTPELRIRKYDTRSKVPPGGISSVSANMSGDISLDSEEQDEKAWGMHVLQQQENANSPAAERPSAVPAGNPNPTPHEVRVALEEYCREAVEHLRKGDLDNSVQCYQKAIEINPNYIPARNNLAIVFEKKPAWLNLAIEQWEVLLELSEKHEDPKHAERARKHLAKLRSK